MTKDEWSKIELQLSYPYAGMAHLLVDGYALTLQVQQIKPLKFIIAVFVNGYCKGEWMKGEADEAKRFCRPVKRAVFSPAKKKAFLKGMTKSEIKRSREFLDLDKTFTFWNLYWTSFGPLKRHLIANNKVIELVQPTPETLV